MDLSKALIAYSLPGKSEFLLATISQIDLYTDDSVLTEYDFIVSPFDKVSEPSYLLKFSSISANKVFHLEASGDINLSSTSYNEYAEAYNTMHQQITDGHLDKAILSKRKVLPTKVNNLYNTFLDVKNSYKSAFTYLIHLPKIGTWMGATPELLAEVKKNEIITRAIAGTLKYSAGNMADIKWGNKEVVEHRFIEQFLQKEFKSRNIRINISPSYTLSAGEVMHICSDIKIASEDLEETLDVIHPGPALSGMPKGKAIALIKRVEPTSRELYCGFLGPLARDETKLFANLRCMKIFKDGYCLYVGGGLTKDSTLEKEWEETELKATTLESIIQKQLQPTQL